MNSLLDDSLTISLCFLSFLVGTAFGIILYWAAIVLTQ